MPIVYVDELRDTRPLRRWPYWISCHMWCENPEVLDRMATRLGIRTKHKHRTHYDLTVNIRKRALKLGCKEVTSRQLDCLMTGVVLANTDRV